MKQKSLVTAGDQHKVILIFIVSIVAILAILSANSSGNAALNPNIVCAEVQSCENWEWAEAPDIFCEEMEIADYKVCIAYSASEEGVVCETWDTVTEENCATWAEGVVWSKECTIWVTETACAPVNG